MPKYIASYDLVKQRDYQTLWDELDRLGGIRVLNSVWYLNVNSSTAKSLRDHLKKFVDSDDRLFVTALGDFASWNALNKISEL